MSRMATYLYILGFFDPDDSTECYPEWYAVTI